MNTLKTGAMMAVLTALFVLIGNALGGTGGMVIAFGFAILTNAFTYWFSDSIAVKMAGAKPVTPEQAPELHAIVDELAAGANMPKPKVHVIPTWQPNAFATGRDPGHASVAVTEGLMRILSYDELRAVLAHELGHVRNRDVLVATIAAVFAGGITMLAQFAQWTMIFGGFRGEDDEDGAGANIFGSLILVILAPIAATIIQLAISRSREYGADESGARLSSDPLALASALAKIDAGAKQIPYEPNPAVASLYIQNPLHGGLRGLFSTHPPTEERIRRLRRMAGLAVSE
jgi:heat shock protein HtpX